MVSQALSPKVETFLPFIKQLTDASGELIRRHWREGFGAVARKADRSVVTATDREVEQLLRAQIMEAYPAHGILGEEFGSVNEDADYQWVLDPIDGTISYIHHVPLFVTLIGLLYQGKPVAGAIHQPILGELALGTPEATTLNGAPVRVAEVPLAEATILCTDPTLVTREQVAKADKFAALTHQAGTFRGWGDGYGYLMVAAGRAHAMLDPILNPWDVLPVIPVVQGAGAVITGWDGAAASDSAIAAAPGLHTEILRSLSA